MKEEKNACSAAALMGQALRNAFRPGWRSRQAEVGREIVSGIEKITQSSELGLSKDHLLMAPVSRPIC